MKAIILWAIGTASYKIRRLCFGTYWKFGSASKSVFMYCLMHLR